MPGTVKAPVTCGLTEVIAAWCPDVASLMKKLSASGMNAPT